MQKRGCNVNNTIRKVRARNNYGKGSIVVEHVSGQVVRTVPAFEARIVVNAAVEYWCLN